MIKGIFIIVLMFVVVASIAQQSENIRNVTFKIWVTDTTGITRKAFLHSITDSALYIMNVEQAIYSDISRNDLIKFDPVAIRAIRIRKNNQVLKGMGIGLLTGAVAGGVIAYSSYESNQFIDFGPGVEAAAGAIVGGTVGTVAGIGAAFAFGTKKYRIDGNISQYQDMRQTLYRRMTRVRK